MRVVLAIDSFKGSLSSIEAAEAASLGIRRAHPEAECVISPIADGGEGTVDALAVALSGKMRSVKVTGPLGGTVNAEYCYIKETKTAVMEMAEAAGITLIEKEKRNPMLATTYGVGEMILDAINEGARHFIIGIGGSLTNDGGAGMLMALGVGLLDGYGKPIKLGAEGLKSLEKVDTGSLAPKISACDFRVACDVKNPLLGESGASYVYARQKGADDEMIAELDQLLSRFAEKTKVAIPTADETAEGTGAAGGLGFALLSYLGAKMSSGIELVMDITGLEEKIKNADIVVCGEGRLDGQSCMGKAPVGVATLAKKHGKRCIAFSGAIGEGAERLNAFGIDAFFPIIRRITTLDEAMDKENAAKNLADTAEQVFRLL